MGQTGAVPLLDIEMRIANAQSYLMGLLAQRERIVTFGSDADYPLESTLLFKRQYDSAGREYAYAALKVDTNSWYLTGRESRRLTFAELVEQHLQFSTSVWRCLEWQEIAAD